MIEFFREVDIISSRNFNKALYSLTLIQNNLLINSDFKVWQRGDEIQLNTTTWTYTADRWRAMGTGKVIKHEQGLKATANNTRVQYVLDYLDYNKIEEVRRMTLSYMLNGIEHSSIIAPQDNTVIFDVMLNQNDVINWARLSLGEKPLPYMPTIYAEELVKCQRYYQKYITTPEQSIKSTIFSSKFVGAFSIPEMRIFPNITTKGIHAYVSFGILPVTYDGSPYSSNNYLNLWFSNPSYPTPTEGYLINKATDGTGGIFLDAEIY